MEKDPKEESAWHTNLPWGVRNDYAQQAMEQRNRDRQGIPKEPTIVPLTPMGILKKLLKSRL